MFATVWGDPSFHIYFVFQQVFFSMCTVSFFLVFLELVGRLADLLIVLSGGRSPMLAGGLASLAVKVPIHDGHHKSQ